MSIARLFLVASAGSGGPPAPIPGTPELRSSLRAKVTSWWSFDGTLADEAAAGNDFAGSVTYDSDPGGGMSLAPTGDFISTDGRNLGINIVHTQVGFAMGMRYKPASVIDRDFIYNIGSAPADGFHESIWMGMDDGKFLIVLRDGGTGTSELVNFTGNTTLQAGKYYHVVLNYQPSTRVVEMYVDGVLEASSTPIGSHQALRATYNQFLLGSEALEYGTNGNIREMFFAHGTLTADEITYLHNNGNRRDLDDFYSEPHDLADFDAANLAMSPTRYYRLNEGSGSAAADDQGSGNGTVTGASWVTTPALPGELAGDAHIAFDGNNDYVDLPNMTISGPIVGFTGLLRQTVADDFDRWLHLGTDVTQNRNSFAWRTSSSAPARAVFEAFGGSNNSVVNSVGTIAWSMDQWIYGASFFDSDNNYGLGFENGLCVDRDNDVTGAPVYGEKDECFLGRGGGSGLDIHGYESRMAIYDGGFPSGPDLKRAWDVLTG